MERTQGQASADQLIDFLRSCYEADRQGTTLWNLFKLPKEKRAWIHQRDPFLRDVFHEAAKFDPAMMKGLFASAKEAGPAESLVYCPFWIRGKLPRPPEQKMEMICSPLLMHPVKRSVRIGGVYIEIDVERRVLNGPLLRTLDPTGALRNALERELEQSSRGMIEATVLAGLLDAFNRHTPDVRTDECLSYPEFVSPAKLNPSNATDSDQVELMPFGACCLVPKSRASLGVLSELEELSATAKRAKGIQEPMLSSCLRTFLGEAPPPPAKIWIPPAVPVDLSGPQRKILESASRHVLTQVVGPPGTGKTYTAAALVLGALSRGESVLIVSRQNQAVDVVYRMIEKMKGSSEGVLRAGRKGYLETMRTRVQQLLNGMSRLMSENKPSRREVEKWRTRVRDKTKELERMERGFARQIKRDQRNSARLTGRSPFWPIYQAYFRVVSTTSPMGARVEDVFEQLESLHRSAAALIEWERDLQITELLDKRRPALVEFDRLLNSSNLAQTVERLGQVDFPSLLKAFPVWLVNAADLFDVLPLQSELFDLVIFDEASQCDIASSLPALQRAKRAVVIGDPEQLRHVSFLADKIQKRFAEEDDLDDVQQMDFDFRRQSLLDVCSRRIATQSAVMMLDEHFRSHPDIIAFSNRQFYGDCLKVMTNTPVYQNQVALQLVLPPKKRRRFAGGVNWGEVETVTSVLRELVQSMNRDPEPKSIGICSPFRNQVEAIRKALEKLPRDWQTRHQIQVDTPHGFQGGERDIMLLSLVLTHDAHATAFRYLGQGNVLNVALTRARSKLIVVTCLKARMVPRSQEVLAALLEHLEAQEQQSIHTGEAKKDPFLDSVKEALEQAGAIVLEDFKLGGEQADLHIDWDGRQFGIDLRGGSGPYHPALSLESCRRFRRAGIPVHTISYVEWTLRPDEALYMIKNFRRKHGQSVK